MPNAGHSGPHATSSTRLSVSPALGSPITPTLISFARTVSQLPQQTNQGTLPKGVRKGRLKGNGRSGLGQFSHPSFGNPIRYEVNFVEKKHQMFVGTVLGDVFFNHGTPRPQNLAGVNHVQNDVRRIHHL